MRVLDRLTALVSSLGRRGETAQSLVGEITTPKLPPTSIYASPQLSTVDDVILNPSKSLIDIVVTEFKESGDLSVTQRFGEKLERQGSYWHAFRLYKEIRDVDGVQRVARQYFLQENDLEKAERLAERAELELTQDLYNQRGTHFFKKALEVGGNSNYRISAEAYIKAGDTSKARECASKLEERGTPFLDDAVWIYLKLRDEESAQRVAKRIFIESVSLRTDLDELKGLDLLSTITKEMWGSRGDYWLQKGDYGKSISAYRKAENVEGIRLAAQKALH